MAAISVARSELGGGEGEEAVQRLRSADPALYLSPSPELSRLSRAASAHLFSSLLPFCPKVPFDRLIAGDGFDAEQIWEQIDSLSRPLVSMLAREMKRLERDDVEGPVKGGGDGGEAAEEVEAGDEEEDDDESEDNELEEVDEDELAEDEEEEEPADAKGSGIEDRFLKIKELEEYLENDEAKEYGHQGRGKENEDAETDDDANFEFGDFGGDDDEDSDLGEYARYEDFFQKRLGGKNSGGIKEKGTSKKVKFVDELEDLEMDEYKDNKDADAEMDEPKDRDVDTWDNALSTHEKELQKIHSNIKQMEKSNLEPKSWTMQGEVTEEVQASIEDLIKKRINEEHFDDVQRAFALPTKAPKELKELDENKSKKGLAEIYEEEYGQKAGLASVPLSSTDEQKRVVSRPRKQEQGRGRLRAEPATARRSSYFASADWKRWHPSWNCFLKT